MMILYNKFNSNTTMIGISTIKKSNMFGTEYIIQLIKKLRKNLIYYVKLGKNKYILK